VGVVDEAVEDSVGIGRVADDVVPLSTKQKALDFYFNFDDPSGAHVAAILAQLRLVSVNRLPRDIYVIPAALFGEVRARLRAFLS
jgi:hypothetical protein